VKKQFQLVLNLHQLVLNRLQPEKKSVSVRFSYSNESKTVKRAQLTYDIGFFNEK